MTDPLTLARADGWEPDSTLPVHDHAFYDDRGYWVHPDGHILDEHHLRELYADDKETTTND
jgi:hypothetical protein